MNRKRFLLFIVFLSFSLPSQAQYALSTAASGLFNQHVALFSLSKNGYHYGTAIWMNRGLSGNRIKTKYFAQGKAYQSYLRWKGNKKVILISSGAYSNGFSENHTPIGVCVEQGQIVNRRIENDMDGLVIVEATGGVRVSDIDNGDLYLGSLGRRINPRTEMYTLLNWAKQEYATVFQSHLLAYGDALRINYNSSTTTATRRMMVIGTANGKVVHVVFHITQPVKLLDATRDIKATMDKRGIKVVGIVNLDTGGNDILEVYNNLGAPFNGVKGTALKHQATNLLVYYYE
ncbi:hypothetical protein [Algivirga pacifica]|uniref:Phosphodiester glycosidase domain-containing protein n=1 Tax=Algivirga pacifica TaxID=1162670 RepID=A0ABP9D8Y2_9BACT